MRNLHCRGAEVKEKRQVLPKRKCPFNGQANVSLPEIMSTHCENGLGKKLPSLIQLFLKYLEINWYCYRS